MPTKQTITKAEYLQLTGLLVLGERYDRALDEVIATITQLTSEENARGRGRGDHCSDAVYNRYSAEELLRKLNIRVVEE